MDELGSDEDKALKRFEIQASREADLVIIQDEERGRLLVAENGLDPNRLVCLPNAPEDDTPHETSDYLREVLGISEKRKIVLHAGSFDTWTSGEEIIKAAHGWPDQYILVIHSRQIPQPEDFICRMQAKSDPSKIRFSTTPLPYDQYGQLIASCDIGLVLYKQSPTIYTQKNLLNVGLSSGKFSYFARHGKPVITSDLPIYRKIFQSHENGISVTSAASIGDVLVRNENRFKEMGRRNRQFYEQKLDFAKNIRTVVDRINACIEHSVKKAS